MHEEYANAYGISRALFDEQTKTPLTDQERKDFALDAVTDHLNKQYAECPNWKTPLEWALERQILFISFVGYLWYFQNDPVEVIQSEVAFDLPLHAPRTGMPLPLRDVVRVGKIDHVIKWQGMVGGLERKSTSRGIDPSSDYWEKSQKDTQVSMYAMALRDMLNAGQLPEKISNLARSVANFGTTLYDVWHKPTIKPKDLSQKDTTEFLSGGTYCGATFTVEITKQWSETYADDNGKEKTRVCAKVLVDGESAEVEPGAKGFAIRETVGMYGARLLADIYERPEFYYVRREIARTDADIKKFRGELFNVYQSMKMFSKNGCWYENESQCRATFPCPHIGICYGPGADAVCDGTTTPPGYRRIFVDLKVNGKDIAED